MDRLVDLVAGALRMEAQRVVDGLEFQAVPEWDSLGHASLMLALEDEYGVTITEDQAVELTSLRAICAFVQTTEHDRASRLSIESGS